MQFCDAMPFAGRLSQWTCIPVQATGEGKGNRKKKEEKIG